MKILTAQWADAEQAPFVPPSLIRWGDGSPATLDEFKSHTTDTHTWICTALGELERRIFPDIVADVRYDSVAMLWALSGEGVKPMALSLTEPSASDEQIIEDLYSFPIIYRVRIHR